MNQLELITSAVGTLTIGFFVLWLIGFGIQTATDWWIKVRERPLDRYLGEIHDEISEHDRPYLDPLFQIIYHIRSVAAGEAAEPPDDLIAQAVKEWDRIMVKRINDEVERHMAADKASREADALIAQKWSACRGPDVLLTHREPIDASKIRRLSLVDLGNPKVVPGAFSSPSIDDPIEEIAAKTPNKETT